MNFIYLYLIISVVYGLIDLRLMYLQEEELSSYPIGDIGYYVKPKKILGIHNWIFFPSWLVIGLWIAIIRLINWMRDLF